MSDNMRGGAPRAWGDRRSDCVGAMERAGGLGTLLRGTAGRTEELRNLPEEIERAVHATGLFRVMQPKRLGGAELPYVSLIDVGDILARGDASVAWNVANLASH